MLSIPINLGCYAFRIFDLSLANKTLTIRTNLFDAFYWVRTKLITKCILPLITLYITLIEESCKNHFLSNLI